MSAYDAFERQLFAAVAVNEPGMAAQVPVNEPEEAVQVPVDAPPEAAQVPVDGDAPSLRRPIDLPAPSARPRRLRRRRARRRLVPTFVGVATAGVLGLVGFATFTGDDGSGGLLSPEAAIAAVRSDLKTGVLHWEATTDDGRIEQWIDLATGASRVDRTAPAKYRRGLAGRQALSVKWRDRKNNEWEQQTRDQRAGDPIVVREHPNYLPPPPNRIPTPIDEIDQALAAGATGKATVEPAGVIGGIPVVLVNQDDRRILWITREPEPRLVKYIRASWSCDPGVDCSKPSNDYTRDALTTTRWEVLPATAATLAEVNPPSPSDGRYEVVDDPKMNKMMKRLAERIQRPPATRK